MREIQRRIVGAALVSKDNKVLVVRSNPAYKGSYEGFWVIPGGGIDQGETAEQAVIREVLEETGIDISTYKCEMLADGRTGQTEKTLKDTGERVRVNMTFTEFRIVLSDRMASEIPVAISSEHCDYNWCSTEELVTLKLSPPTQAFFKLMGYMK